MLGMMKVPTGPLFKMTKTLGVLLSMLSAVTLAAGFITSKKLMQQIPLLPFVFWWFASASLFLFVIILVRKDISFFGKIRGEVKTAAAIAFMGVITSVLFFAALSFLEPSFYAFLIRLATIVTIVLGVVLLKERFTSVELLGAVIALIGAFVLSYAFSNFLTLGVVLGVAAALAIGIQDFVWKTIVKDVHPVAMNFYRTFASAVAVLLYLLATKSFELVPLDMVPLLLLGSFISPVLGVFFLIKAMANLEVSKVVAIRTLEPFIVVAFAFIFFNTIPDAKELAGGTMIIVGVSVMTLFHHIRTKVRGMIGEG